MRRAETTSRSTIVWTLVIVVLVLARLPSLVQPAGSDQAIYAYVGQRVIAGGVPYVDAWDQKPPVIHFLYAFLWRIWPHESVVAAADLTAAALVAWLLIVLGRRTAGSHVGYLAAGLFLLWSDPWLTRLSGLYVRAQCETFVALAVTTALVLLTGPARRRSHLVLAGAWFAVAVWLKYNALAYALPLMLALWTRPAPDTTARTGFRQDALWVAAGAALVTIVTLTYFAAHGALEDLRLATIDYNLQYSRQTYTGVASLLTYPLVMPIARARVDMLWFLGGLGALLLIAGLRRDGSRWTPMLLGWLVATVLSIAVNGARGLPQYFVQAGPMLAIVAAAGLATLRAKPLVLRLAVGAVLLAGLWRVGDEPGHFWRPRLGGLPEAFANMRFDLAHARGQIDRDRYLARFAGDKYDARAIEAMTRLVATTTQPQDRILVFGFAPGVYVRSARVSASRFFWSRPVVIEFGTGRPGYGSASVLQELDANRPALVAVQKQDWAAGGDTNSIDFIASHTGFVTFFDRFYVREPDTPLFAIWRRKS